MHFYSRTRCMHKFFLNSLFEKEQFKVRCLLNINNLISNISVYELHLYKSRVGGVLFFFSSSHYSFFLEIELHNNKSNFRKQKDPSKRETWITCESILFDLKLLLESKLSHIV
jgi:hypothetical protein